MFMYIFFLGFPQLDVFLKILFTSMSLVRTRRGQLTWETWHIPWKDKPKTLNKPSYLSSRKNKQHSGVCQRVATSTRHKLMFTLKVGSVHIHNNTLYIQYSMNKHAVLINLPCMDWIYRNTTILCVGVEMSLLFPSSLTMTLRWAHALEPVI